MRLRSHKRLALSPRQATKLIRVSLLLLAMALLALAFAAGSRYEGHWFVYLLFTLLANALLANGFRKNAIYFDTFIGIFLWLGFWLKFSARVAFASGLFHEPVGAFNRSAEAFDHALLVSSCGFAALLVASLLRARFFAYPVEPLSCNQFGLFQFYRSYRKHSVAVFLGLVVLVAGSNAWLGIYQRGMVTQTTLPFGLNGVYKWLLQFGLASIAALIIRFEIELNRNISLMAVFPPLLEGFFSNVSLLSRGMILNSTALAIGGLRTISATRARVDPVILSVAMIAFVALFAASVFAVNYIRASSLTSAESAGAASLVAAAQSMATPLLIDRWVGIEGVMAVSSSTALSWDLWREALQEKFKEGQLSLYDRRLIDSPYTNLDIDKSKSKHHFVSLPGVIAFMYYPGSFWFLFLGLLAFGLMASLLEIATYRFAGQNWVLCSLIGQVIAYRYACFGYVPTQSYLLFGALLLNVLIIFCADRVLRWHFGNNVRSV